MKILALFFKPQLKGKTTKIFYNFSNTFLKFSLIFVLLPHDFNLVIRQRELASIQNLLLEMFFLHAVSFVLQRHAGTQNSECVRAFLDVVVERSRLELFATVFAVDRVSVVPHVDLERAEVAEA